MVLGHRRGVEYLSGPYAEGRTEGEMMSNETGVLIGIVIVLLLGFLPALLKNKR